MEFLHDLLSQSRRAAVDVLNGAAIDSDSPFSPDVPEDLRHWLPDLFDRFPIVLPWSRPEPVDPALHTVWLLDNAAFRTPPPGDHRPDLAELRDPNATQPRTAGGLATRGGSGWEVEFVACYFIKNSGQALAQATAALMRALDVTSDDVATQKRIAARLEPFVDAVLPNRTLRISIGGQEEQTLGPSSHSGISSALHELHFPAPTPPSRTIESSPVNLPPPFGLPAITTFSDETGWAVVSDIDDTIKITQSPSPLGILTNTFLIDTPQAVPGMPDLYNKMSILLAQPPFFYLSASPYPLYPFLRRFRDAHAYPSGPLILRDASWQNLGGLITSLQQNTQEYKEDRLAKIHAWFPHRRVVCLGDSTQSDPEAYGATARRFPGWIRAVFIRKVTGIAEMNEREKNSAGRFEKAFEGLERRLWHVFTDPKELEERMEELSKNPEALVGGEMYG